MSSNLDDPFSTLQGENGHTILPLCKCIGNICGFHLGMCIFAACVVICLGLGCFRILIAYKLLPCVLQWPSSVYRKAGVIWHSRLYRSSLNKQLLRTVKGFLLPDLN